MEAQSIRLPDPSAPLRFGRDEAAFKIFEHSVIFCAHFEDEITLYNGR